MEASFFEVLDRVQQIRSDCKVLLRSHDQRAGLEILDAMALQAEAAYERLFRWIRIECAALDGESPDLKSLFKRGFQSLRSRPVLLKHCVSDVVAIRRSSVQRAFIQALTMGGNARPIDLHAYDALRYVGDILAWTHQTLAGERELLLSLFETESEMLIISLGEVMEGVCESVEVRHFLFFLCFESCRVE